MGLDIAGVYHQPLEIRVIHHRLQQSSPHTPVPPAAEAAVGVLPVSVVRGQIAPRSAGALPSFSPPSTLSLFHAIYHPLIVLTTPPSDALRINKRSIRSGFGANREKISATEKVLDNLVRDFGRFYYRELHRAGDFSGFLMSRTLTFQSTLDFASCSVIGDKLFVYVWPVAGGLHRMVVSHRSEDEAAAIEPTLDLLKVGESSSRARCSDVDMLVHLLENSFGVIACSLASFDQLSADQRERTTDAMYKLWLKQPYSPHHIQPLPGYHLFLKQRYSPN